MFKILFQMISIECRGGSVDACCSLEFPFQCDASCSGHLRNTVRLEHFDHRIYLIGIPGNFQGQFSLSNIDDLRIESICNLHDFRTARFDGRDLDDRKLPFNALLVWEIRHFTHIYDVVEMLVDLLYGFFISIGCDGDPSHSGLRFRGKGDTLQLKTFPAEDADDAGKSIKVVFYKYSQCMSVFLV